MAKKTDKNKINNELDIDDDIGDDIDLSGLDGFSESRSPNRTEISKELGKEVGKSFLKSLIKKTTFKSLPDEYESNYNSALEYKDITTEVLGKNKEKIEKSLYRLGIQVKRLLPFQSKILNKYLESQEYKYEKAKIQNEEEARDSFIVSNIASIFDKQLEIQKNIEAKNSAEREVQNRQNLAVTKLNIDILTNIDKNIANQTAFTLQINKEYYRKSLELQYKSYFVQADMLRSIRDYYKAFSIQFDSIVKNTSLPDFVKLNNTEKFKDILRGKAIDNVISRTFTSSKFINTFKNRFNNLVSDKVDNIVNNIDTVTDAIGNINDLSEMPRFGSISNRAYLLSNIVGSILGSKLGDKISSKIGPIVKENKYVKSGANYLSILTKNPSYLFKKIKNISDNKLVYNDSSTPLGFLRDKLYSGISTIAGLGTHESINKEIGKSSILEASNPAIFDNKVHRSISEVIPMYLSKILQETSTLRNMYSVVNSNKLGNIGLEKSLYYSYTDRKLMSKEDLIISEQNNLFNENNSSAINNVTNTILAKSKGKLNKEDYNFISKNKNIFTDYLTKASNNIKYSDFNYDVVIDKYENNEYLRNKVNSDVNLKRYIDIIKSIRDSKKDIDSNIKDIKNIYPINTVKKVFSDISTLARSELKIDISDKAAMIIAKALTNYIYLNNSDIVVENILSGNCFKYIEKNDFNTVKNNVLDFINNIYKINSKGDVFNTSRLDVYISELNTALRDKIEVSADVFREINRYSNILQPNTVLTIENLVEKKLGDFNSKKDYVGNKEIMFLSNNKNKENISVKKEKLDSLANVFNSIISKGKIGNKISKFKDDLNNVNNYSDARKLVSDIVSNIVSSIKEKGKGLYTKIDTSLDDISKFLKNTKNKNKNDIKEYILNKIDSSISNINSLLNIKYEELNTNIKKFNTIENDISNKLNNDDLNKEIKSEINGLIKYIESEISILTKFRDKMVSLRQSIYEIDTSKITIKDFALNIKSSIKDAINDIKDLLDKNKTTATA